MLKHANLLEDLRSNYSKTKSKLIEKFGEQCYLCGINHPLEVAHIVPISHGGTEDLENFRLVCPNCHFIMDTGNFRESDFEQYLSKILKSNPNYSNVVSEKIIGSSTKKRIDLFAETNSKKLYIEVRALSFLNSTRINEIIKQLEIYQNEISDGELVLAFPGVLSESANKKFSEHRIAVWDIPYISRTFKKEISHNPHPIFDILFSSRHSIEIEKELIEKLKKTKSGKSEWNIYQKLMNEILERIFCPPLDSPIYELSDEYKVNRRDFILPNYSETGFWAYIRNLYNAHFVVIDAKNYTKKVQKKDILQLSNYLKEHGAGLFGIIITRNGGDVSSDHTIKEIWAIQKKLIIILNDEDIIQMLTLKASGNYSEAVIKQKIERFRLSL